LFHQKERKKRKEMQEFGSVKEKRVGKGGDIEKMGALKHHVKTT